MCVVPFGPKNKKRHLQKRKWHFDTQITLLAFAGGTDTLCLYYIIAELVRQWSKVKR